MDTLCRISSSLLVVLLLATTARPVEEPPDEVDRLTAGWRDIGDDERLRRIRRLGDIGPPAAKAIGHLYGAWEEKFREASKKAIDRIDPEKTERVIHLLERAHYIDGSDLYPNRELVALGPRIVPKVIEAPAGEGRGARYAGIAILGRFGVKAMAAIPALRKVHADPEDECRRFAALSLFLIDPGTKGILPELIHARAENRWSFPDILFAELMAAYPRLDEELATLLAAPSIAVRNAAVDALLEMPSLPRAVPTLASYLSAEPAGRRVRAAIVLAKHAGWTLGLGAALAEGLSRENVGLHERTVEVIREMGSGGRTAALALADVVRNGTWKQREPAVRALGNIGQPEIAVPILLEVLEGRFGTERRMHAAKALTAYGNRARDAIPILIRILPETHVSSTCHGGFLKKHVTDGIGWAAEALGGFGPLAAEAVPGLIDLFHRSRYPARMASLALAKIGEPAIPDLLRILDEEDQTRPGMPQDTWWRVRQAAMHALSRMDGCAERRLPTLRRGIEDADSIVAGHAASGLTRLAPGSREAIRVLSAALLDEEIPTRTRVKWLVAVRKMEDARLLPVVRAARGAKDNEVRLFATYAHYRLANDPAVYLEELLKQLRTGNSRERQFAADYLGGLGPKAAPAIPALEEAVKDERWSIRSSAKDALKKIRTKDD